jgi:hypothetical protein
MWGCATLDRPLSRRERLVLETLLSGSFPGVDGLRHQVPSVVVSGMCGCGCPTVFFSHPEKGQGIEVAADAAVVGTGDSVLLFISAGGRLDSMEYVWVGDAPPAEFPPPAHLVLLDRR